MIPHFTDRIAISSRLPRWGNSGVIAAIAGMMVRTDQPLDWTGSGHVMILRSEVGEPSGLIPVTRGGDDDEAILGADPGFDLSPGWTQEPTHYLLRHVGPRRPRLHDRPHQPIGRGSDRDQCDDL